MINEYELALKDAQSTAQAEFRLVLGSFQRRWNAEAKAYIEKKAEKAGHQISDATALGREAAEAVMSNYITREEDANGLPR
jgi:hypothetical protein